MAVVVFKKPLFLERMGSRMKKGAVIVSVGAVVACGVIAGTVIFRSAPPSASSNLKAYESAGMPWTLADLPQERIDSGPETAAFFIRKAIPLLPKDADGLAFMTTQGDAMLPSEADAVLKLLDPYGPSLKEARTASERDVYGHGWDWDMDTGKVLPEISKVTRLVHLLNLRAEAKLLTGDVKGGLEDWEAGVRLCLLTRQISDSIAALYTAYHSHGTAQFGAKLIHGQPENALVVEKVLKGLTQLDVFPDWKSVVKADAYSYLSAFRNSQSQEEALRFLGKDIPLDDPFRKRIVREGLPEKKEMQESLAPVLAAYTQIGREMSDPAIDLNAMIKAVDQIEQKAEIEGKGAGAYRLSQVLRGMARAQAQIRTSHCLAKLHQAKLKGGSEVAKAKEEALTILDPISNQPIKFLSRESGIKVWSIGLDGVDDGGITLREARSAVTSITQTVTYDEVAEHPMRMQSLPYMRRQVAAAAQAAGNGRPRRPSADVARFQTPLMKPGSNGEAPLSIRREFYLNWID
jgi:hypothetical protein